VKKETVDGNPQTGRHSQISPESNVWKMRCEYQGLLCLQKTRSVLNYAELCRLGTHEKHFSAWWSRLWL